MLVRNEHSCMEAHYIFPPINSWAIDVKSDLHSAIYGSDSYMFCSLNTGLLQIESDWTHKHPLFFIWEPCWGSPDELGGDSTDTEPPLSPKLERFELNYDGMCLLLKIHLVTLSHIYLGLTSWGKNLTTNLFQPVVFLFSTKPGFWVEEGLALDSWLLSSLLKGHGVWMSKVG